MAAAENGTMSVLVLVVMIRAHRVTLVTRAGRIRAGQIAALIPLPRPTAAGFRRCQAEGARMAVEGSWGQLPGDSGRRHHLLLAVTVPLFRRADICALLTLVRC